MVPPRNQRRTHPRGREERARREIKREREKGRKKERERGGRPPPGGPAEERGSRRGRRRSSAETAGREEVDGKRRSREAKERSRRQRGRRADPTPILSYFPPHPHPTPFPQRPSGPRATRFPFQGTGYRLQGEQLSGDPLVVRQDLAGPRWGLLRYNRLPCRLCSSRSLGVGLGWRSSALARTRTLARFRLVGAFSPGFSPGAVPLVP